MAKSKNNESLEKKSTSYLNYFYKKTKEDRFPFTKKPREGAIGPPE